MRLALPTQEPSLRERDKHSDLQWTPVTALPSETIPMFAKQYYAQRLNSRIQSMVGLDSLECHFVPRRSQPLIIDVVVLICIDILGDIECCIASKTHFLWKKAGAGDLAFCIGCCIGFLHTGHTLGKICAFRFGKCRLDASLADAEKVIRRGRYKPVFPVHLQYFRKLVSMIALFRARSAVAERH